MTTEQNMLDVIIQHQVYRYRASTKVVNELQGQVDEALRHVVDHGGYDNLTHVTNILKGNKDEKIIWIN